MNIRIASQRLRLLPLLWLVLTVSCIQSKTTVYRDSNVVAMEKHAPFYPLNVHGGDTTYLRIAGREYKGVRGAKPYYLDVPEIHAILFVTEGRNSKVNFHIVNLDTKKET